LIGREKKGMDELLDGEVLAAIEIESSKEKKKLDRRLEAFYL